MWHKLEGLAELERAGIAYQVVTLPFRHYTPTHTINAVQPILESFSPEVVWIGDTYFFKPHLALAWPHYPVFMRYYAFEGLCPNYNERFIWQENRNCNEHLLKSFTTCRNCFLRRCLTDRNLDLFKWEFFTSGGLTANYRKLVENSLRQAQAVMVSNPAMAQLLAPYSENTVVVPGGFDPNCFFPKTEYRETGPLTLLMSGRVTDSAKGIFLLRQALDKLILEQGCAITLKVTAKENFDRDYIKPLGWLTAPVLAEEMRQADLFVSPAIWDEPFGLGLLEAMACGTPVIASDVPGHRYSLGQFDVALLYDATSPDDLRQQIRRFYQDRTTLSERGRQASRFVSKRFTWKQLVTDHYLPLLEKLASK